MSIKRYSSPCAKFTINVKLKGKQTPVTFDRYDHDDKRRFIDISDKDTQEFMEKSPDFNVYFRLDSTTVDPDQPVITDVKSFANNTDAKEWINKYHSVPYNRIINKPMLTEEYAKIGYELQIETIKK